MKFSVITITRNNSDGLSLTMNSIENQSFLNFEWIIIDGDSSDSTSDVVRKCEFKKLIFVSEKDDGIFDAMNKGISLASGDYFIFMNAGDVFFDSNVLNFANELIENKPSIAYGDSYETDSKGKVYRKSARNPYFNAYSMFTHHQSIFYRSDILRLMGGYDTSYRFSADWALTTRILREASLKDVLYLEFPVCKFERGGVSQRDEYRSKINSEHWRILRSEAGYGPLRASFLWFVKTRINIFRKMFPRFYDLIRFGGGRV